MVVELFQPPFSADWDAFASRCPMATFLHTRRYLSYHGARFHDLSLIARDGRSRIVGLLPAAADPAQPSRVCSHPGLTYGGWLHDGRLAGEAMLAAFHTAAELYSQSGFTTLRYKVVPAVYQRQPAQDDAYALFRLGASRVRCDLSCAIDLRQTATPNENRRRALRKALGAGCTIDEMADLSDYWPLLETTLAGRHRARPTHTLDEMRVLQERFPENIRLTLARRAGRPVAGVVVYRTATVDHAQYIASNDEGNALNALDAVFAQLIDRARQSGKSHFDFGISNEDHGRVLNQGLYQFKSGFGGGGVVHEFYDWRFGSES